LLAGIFWTWQQSFSKSKAGGQAGNDKPTGETGC